MRRNEVQLIYYFEEDKAPEPFKSFMSEGYTFRRGDEPKFHLLFTLSAHRQNKVPKIVKTARKLSSKDLYFKLLEIPLTQTIPTTKDELIQLTKQTSNTSKIVVGMKIKEDDHDIEYLILEITLPDSYSVYAYPFPDWKADNQRAKDFLAANPGYID